MLTREVAVFACAFAFIIGLFAAVGLLWWSLLFVLVGASLALVEYLVWRKTNLIVMALGYALLTWHLIAMR